MELRRFFGLLVAGVILALPTVAAGWYLLTIPYNQNPQERIDQDLLVGTTAALASGLACALLLRNGFGSDQAWKRALCGLVSAVMICFLAVLAIGLLPTVYGPANPLTAGSLAIFTAAILAPFLGPIGIVTGLLLRPLVTSGSR